jgi:hypothetical protein
LIPADQRGHPTLREFNSVKPCNQNIQNALDLIQAMIRLADQGDAEREDVGCGILYGVLRDSAYRLKRLAEDEKARHIAKGWWDEQN